MEVGGESEDGEGGGVDDRAYRKKLEKKWETRMAAEEDNFTRARRTAADKRELKRLKIKRGRAGVDSLEDIVRDVDRNESRNKALSDLQQFRNAKKMQKNARSKFDALTQGGDEPGAARRRGREASKRGGREQRCGGGEMLSMLSLRW